MQNKTIKWLSTVMEFMLPKVENEEYQYRLSKHQEGTLCSGGRKSRKQSSYLLRIRILLDLVGTSRPGTEPSEILVHGSSIKETRPEGSDILC